MKKILFSCVVVLSVISCKKGEVSETTINEMVDSASAVANSIHEDIQHGVASDTLIAKLKDSAESKITQLTEEKKLLTEKVAKEIDSASKEVIVSQIKTAQNKIDSVKQEVATVGEKIKATPKIIKETKVIYKETPVKVVKEPVAKISKSGEVQIRVEDMDVARESTLEQIAKYDGIIKNEQVSGNSNSDTNYLKVQLPADKTEYLINDLERYVGSIEYRNISTTGQEYTKTSMCDIEVALFREGENAVVASKPETFGGRTGQAFASGWNVIQEIFLFILPFWPVFLIGGGVYYYFKKKKSTEAEEHNA